MSQVDQSSSSGADQQASGEADQSKKSQENLVAYETHQKLLSEKKKVQAELEDYRKKEKERLEKEMNDKQEYQKLLKLREEELQKVASDKAELENRFNSSIKLTRFLQSVNGKIDPQYYGLIDLDNIVMNPESGMPDDASLQKAVKDFEQKFSLVIQKADAKTLPQNAAQGSGSGKISYEEWKKLPLKEMKKYKMGDIN